MMVCPTQLIRRRPMEDTSLERRQPQEHDEHTKEEHEGHHKDVERLKVRVGELHDAVAELELRVFELEASVKLPE